MLWSFKNERLLLIGSIWNHVIGQVRSNFNPIFVFKLKHYRYILSVYTELMQFCHNINH